MTEICLTLQSYRYIKEVCVLIGFHGNNFVITFCYVNFCFATRCKSSRIMENHGKSINFLNPPHLALLKGHWTGKEKGGEKLEKSQLYIL